MKKIGLFFLAVVMVAGMAGCSSSGDNKLTAADMAGTYILLTQTKDGVPTNAVSGSITLTLTSSGTCSMVGTNGSVFFSGTFTVDDPNIYFTDAVTKATGTGVITDDGKTITTSSTEEGKVIVTVFTKS